MIGRILGVSVPESEGSPSAQSKRSSLSLFGNRQDF